MSIVYADIVVARPLGGIYTYLIPGDAGGDIVRGSLVTVPFGKSSATGLVIKVHDTKPEGIELKPVSGLLTDDYLMNEPLIRFLMWVSDYYLAYPGEALKAALPSPKYMVTKPVRRAGSGKEPAGEERPAGPAELTTIQLQALKTIRESFAAHDTVLLHGVTSSGKTEIYIHLISEQLAAGLQVLYMLPEIALTTQIIGRLTRHFGSEIGVYHSRLTPAVRREVWQRVSDGTLRAVLGVRSSLFLPFSDLGLIIVDEEHDPSYKQHEPAPRYHARDSAIMLAHIHGGKTVLGSATPSLESYHNARSGRYGLAELNRRYGEVMMPEMVIADTRTPGRRRGTYFSATLLDAVEEALRREEQVILFQNRRGFAPFLICNNCGHVPTCKSCSVSLTYHKGIGRLVCHYCGRRVPVPAGCPECGVPGLMTRGLGTEKVEEEIKLIFPNARVARIDQDAVRNRQAAAVILGSFAAGDTDILIGTQMISKGLDFERLTVVGILDADNMMHFPDFRAWERSFQLMAQVSGRAGRRTRRGRVIIQTVDPSNSILRHVLKHDYHTMSREQLEERELFGYPPFARIIRIVIRHRDPDVLNIVADRIAGELGRYLGGNLLGPDYPMVRQIQRWHIKNIIIKIGSALSPSKVKELVNTVISSELARVGGALRIHADVDPQ